MDNEILELVKQIARYAKGGHVYRVMEIGNQLEKLLEKQEQAAAKLPLFEKQQMKLA